MFTSVDKALVACIMGAVYILNSFGVVTVGLSEQTIATIVGVLTPMIVWLVPNKKIG